jgi:hypothetical protein
MRATNRKTKRRIGIRILMPIILTMMVIVILTSCTKSTGPVKTDQIKLVQTSEDAFRLIRQADQNLTPRARAAWHRRIFYLRALIDRELVRTDGWFEGVTLKDAFEELTKIYHSEKHFDHGTCV